MLYLGIADITSRFARHLLAQIGRSLLLREHLRYDVPTEGEVFLLRFELRLVGSALLWICEDGCRLRLCCFEGSTHSLLGWAVATVVWVFHTHTYGGIVFLAVAEVNLIRTRELLRNRIEGGGVFDKSHIVGIGLQCKRLCRFAR